MYIAPAALIPTSRRGRYSLETAFRDGGLEVAAISDNNRSELLVHGRRVRCSTRGGERTMAHVYDRIVAEEFSEVLVRSVRRAIKGNSITIEWVDRGVVVSHEERPVLKIKASHGIHLPSETRVDGNFLATGEHWQRLLNAARPFVHHSFPAGLDQGLAEHALVASRKIASERTIAYGLSVRLNSPGHGIQLRIDPVQRHHGLLQFRFSLSTHNFSLEGGILLGEDCHPLPVIEHRLEGSRDDLGFAWAVALIGIADLTCVDQSEDATTTVVHPRSDGRAAEFRRPENPRDAKGAKWHHGETLTPLAKTFTLAAGYVAGHRRRLTRLQECSEQARNNALAVGINLHTPVRGLTRAAGDVLPGRENRDC